MGMEVGGTKKTVSVGGARMAHPPYHMQGKFKLSTLLTRKAVYGTTNGAVFEVYERKGDAAPKMRANVADMKLSRNGKAFLMGDGVKITPKEDTLDDWEMGFKALKNHDFGRYYNVGELMDKGPHGAVSVAVAKESGQMFAVKIIDLEKHRKFLPYFLQEAELLKRVNSPHVVRAHDVFMTTDTIHIVMELMNYGSLKSVVEKRRLKEQQVAWIMYHLLSGIRDVHAAGVIHRDVCIENVLLKYNTADAARPMVKLGDLGLAFDMNRRHASSEKFIGGQAINLAPEVYHKRFGPEVDNWAAGMVCYELLAGKHPFRTRDKSQLVFEAGVVGKVPFSRDQWAALSPEAVDFTRQLLRTNPADRLSAAAALDHPFLADTRAHVERRPIPKANTFHTFSSTGGTTASGVSREV